MHITHTESELERTIENYRRADVAMSKFGLRVKHDAEWAQPQNKRNLENSPLLAAKELLERPLPEMHGPEAPKPPSHPMIKEFLSEIDIQNPGADYPETGYWVWPTDGVPYKQLEFPFVHSGGGKVRTEKDREKAQQEEELSSLDQDEHFRWLEC